jgi:hypothetical protein
MSIIGDGNDDEHRFPLPVSVDRVLGQVVPRPERGHPVLNEAAVEKLEEYLATVDKDSNLDRIQLTAEIDILIDGNEAVAALVEGLRHRFANKISSNEVLMLLPATR